MRVGKEPREGVVVGLIAIVVVADEHLSLDGRSDWRPPIRWVDHEL